MIGTGVGGLDTVGERLVPMTDAGKVRRLGSTIVEQVMGSGVSARVSGLLALGNQVTSNSSACSTGTEAIVEGATRIRHGPRRAHAVRRQRGRQPLQLGRVRRDARALAPVQRRAGEGVAPDERQRRAASSPAPARASCTSRASSRRAKRGARIHAELLGGALNCGGHRGGGSMTAPNPESVRRCIRAALADAGIEPARGRRDQRPPHRHRRRPQRGRGLGGGARARPGRPAADHLDQVDDRPRPRGGRRHRVRGLHPDAARAATFTPRSTARTFTRGSRPSRASIPHELRTMPQLRTIIKASFGFGDVNACVVFRKWTGER